MRGWALKLFVERALLAQHAVDDVGGDAARGEAGHLGGGRMATASWNCTTGAGKGGHAATNRAVDDMRICQM